MKMNLSYLVTYISSILGLGAINPNVIATKGNSPRGITNSSLIEEFNTFNNLNNTHTRNIEAITDDGMLKNLFSKTNTARVKRELNSNNTSQDIKLKLSDAAVVNTTIIQSGNKTMISDYMDRQDVPEYWNTQAMTLRDQGKYPEALNAIKKAIKLKNDVPDYWNIEASLLYYMGEYPKALKAIKKAIKLKNDVPDYWYNKVIILNHMCKYPEALNAIKKAIKLKNDVPDYWNTNAFILDHMGKYPEALNAIEEAIKLKNDVPAYWNTNALILDHMGKYPEALNAIKEAIKLKNDVPAYWNTNALILAHMGKYPEALNAIKEAIKLKNDVLEYWNTKVLILDHMGKGPEYQDAVTEYMKLDRKEYAQRFQEYMKEHILEQIKHKEPIEHQDIYPDASSEKLISSNQFSSIKIMSGLVIGALCALGICIYKKLINQHTTELVNIDEDTQFIDNDIQLREIEPVGVEKEFYDHDHVVI